MDRAQLRRPGRVGGPALYLAHWLSELWWYLVWVFAASALIRRRHLITSSVVPATIASFAAYFLIIHSVFESQSRYHMPSVGPLLVLSMLAFHTARGSRGEVATRPTHN
jgi:hypothetical protein